jgi:hypothetical protein
MQPDTGNKRHTCHKSRNTETTTGVTSINQAFLVKYIVSQEAWKERAAPDSKS